MRAAGSIDDFVGDPVDAWVVAGTTLIWVKSSELCGVVCWGSPGEADALATLRCFDAFLRLAPRFDVLMDGTAMERVDPLALAVIIDWTKRNFQALSSRLRTRIGVPPEGMTGLVLAGLQPIMGGPGPVEIIPTPEEAFQRVLPQGGPALHEEVRALARTARGTPAWLLELRALLPKHGDSLDLGEAARRLAMSTRSLQRALTEQGTSFRNEQHDARFRLAEELLASDEKLSAIAARLGLTEAGLTRLVRGRTGLSPGEYRKSRRS